jgi:hypothetical protein
VARVERVQRAVEHRLLDLAPVTLDLCGASAASIAMTVRACSL